MTRFFSIAALNTGREPFSKLTVCKKPYCHIVGKPVFVLVCMQ
jgi:hypothetical protein